MPKELSKSSEIVQLEMLKMQCQRMIEQCDARLKALTGEDVPDSCRSRRVRGKSYPTVQQAIAKSLLKRDAKLLANLKENTQPKY